MLGFDDLSELSDVLLIFLELLELFPGFFILNKKSVKLQVCLVALILPLIGLICFFSDPDKTFFHHLGLYVLPVNDFIQPIDLVPESEF